MKANIINVRNVNYALQEGLHWLAAAGTVADSRNGPVLVAPGPVLTIYSKPQERVMFSAWRDANPFFHLYECIWMLAGRRDAASVAYYARTMDSFADEGILHGSYGFRWREWFGFDQLKELVKLLKAEPNTRRAVLQMWDPRGDLQDSGHAGGGASKSKDVPCNTAVYFDATDGHLNMTVTNRSNDIVWGAYGANAVHMSFLQEVIAAAVGVPVGAYAQFSNNYHTYLDRPDVARLIEKREEATTGYNVYYASDDRYGNPAVKPFVTSPRHMVLDTFLRDCEVLAGVPDAVLAADAHPFLRHVFVPMMAAHKAYKAGDYEAAHRALTLCQASDWATAGAEWLYRRQANAEKKKAGAV